LAGGALLSGGGSPFAAIEMDQWTEDAQSIVPPLDVGYTASSAGIGSTYFSNGLYRYAVSDIASQGAAGGSPPTFSFEYVPIVAEGLGFMYNLPGDPTLYLNAATACGIFTGEITNWDASAIAALNPDVPLPNLAITPVLPSNLSGANWVLEDWCMTEVPAVWDSFVDYVNANKRNVSPPVGLTTPSSAIPVVGDAEIATGDSSAAAVVGSGEGTGDVTYVEPEYAKQYGNKPVAYVQNASGDFVQPTPENVSGALSYATGQPNGTQSLNFGGTGCNVYNPSTYSYLLARTDGAYGRAYGQTLGGFLNYVLTTGQKEPPSIDYASIGLALERFGIQQAQHIPGDPALTSDEQANFAPGDVTPSIVQSTSCGAAFQFAPPNAKTDASSPTQGQIPETPSVPLLPLAAIGAAGAGFFMVHTRRRRRVGV
jgi:phosphate transport system substrate-binding protein